jgi:DNA repair exonuclease SbcCD ATPase subunit
LEVQYSAASGELDSLLARWGGVQSYQDAAERLRQDLVEVDEELSSAGSTVAARRTQLKNLNTEARFHSYRLREETLKETLDTGLEAVRDAHRQFLDLLDTLRDIRDALRDAFNSALNTTLPKVGELMTEVYGRLTQQTSFPIVMLQSGSSSTALRTVEVKVTSPRTAGVLFVPSEVLNGQAFSALNLVPYFVFSQFQAEALELDCLLIDDPSQSFDTSRMELLLKELSTAALHAQLVVASHEGEKFEPFVDKYFEANSYRVLRVTDFTPEGGPVLERGWQVGRVASQLP